MSIFNPEDSVLKCLMADAACYWQVCEVICPEDFTPKARRLYEAIAIEAKAGRACDPVTLADSLGDGLGMYAYETYSDAVGSAQNVLMYAEMMAKNGEAKRVCEAGQRIAVSDGSYAGAQTLLAEVRPQEMAKVKSVKDGLAEMLEAAQRRADGPYGISWGVHGLDAIAGRLAPSRLYGIAARAKMGKTTLSLPPQIRAVLDGKRVLDFSLEMTVGELVQASLAYVGQFSASVFEREDGIPDEAWSYIHSAAAQLSNTPWMIDDTPALTMAQIEARAIQRHMQEPLDLIVIDHIGLIKLPHRKGASHSDELGEVSYGLKNLAKRLKVPVLALIQLNRSLETRTDKRPTAPDLRDSGNLEQDFDCVVSVYRDEVYNPESRDAGHAEIATLFNRHGRGGIAFVSADMDRKSFGEPTRARQCYPGAVSGGGSAFGGYNKKVAA